MMIPNIPRGLSQPSAVFVLGGHDTGLRYVCVVHPQACTEPAAPEVKLPNWGRISGWVSIAAGHVVPSTSCRHVEVT